MDVELEVAVVVMLAVVVASAALPDISESTVVVEVSEVVVVSAVVASVVVVDVIASVVVSDVVVVVVVTVEESLAHGSELMLITRARSMFAESNEPPEE